MTGVRQRKELVAWSLALVAVAFAFLLSQSMILELYGKVSWTGVTAGTLTAIVRAIESGLSIYSAAYLAVGFLAGPVAAALTAIGRGLILTLIRRWGIKKLVQW